MIMNNCTDNMSFRNSHRRPLMTSMLVITTALAVFSQGCSSFVFPSSSSITTSTTTTTTSVSTSGSLLSIKHQQQAQIEHQLLFRNNRRIIHTTKLFAQKKKPRFSQQGSHIAQDSSQRKTGGGGSAAFKRKNKRNSSTPNNNSKRPRRPPPIQQHKPWASGKSIDDLENTMSKRWGTLDDSSGGIPEEYEFFDGDESDFEIEEDDDNDVGEIDFSSQNTKSKKNSSNDGSDRWRRPVIDPWDEEEEKAAAPSKKSKNDNKFTGEREYYDQDDEGFEIIGEDENADDILDDILFGDDEIPRVDHLIAPKPAGGQGTNRKDTSSTTSSEGGGYFFNPNAAANAAATAKKNEDLALSKKKEAALSNAEEGDENDKRRNRSGPAKPLFDETTGKPRLLTVGEAFNQFQGSIDEGTMEIIETAEVPILAKKVNAQSWDDLGITSPILLENLQYMNCPNPLAVQEKTTPAILTGNDVLVGTYTGSGKTLAFLVPLVQRLLWNIIDDLDDDDDDTDNGNKINDPGLAVIIIAPGRELASQIVSVARDLLQDTGLKAQLAIGGTTFKRNLEQLRKRKPNIVVGTPGRIAELVVGKPGEKSGRLKIGNLQSLVLDEFDALLEYKAHRDPTRAIMQSLKRRHGDSLQSVLCSATATDIMDSSKVVDYLRPGFETAMADLDDVLVTSTRINKEGSQSSAIAAQVSRTIIHGVINVPHKRMALDAVRKILHTEPVPQQILIFAENARKVDIVVEKLAERGIIAAALHGGMGSEKMDRAEVSKALREGYVGIVVATELAARGLDAPLLTHVINLDLPTDASHYAHRSGRCGRGGRPGVVINITTSPQERKVPKRFADTLGVEMFTAETRGGKLILVDPATQTLDQRERDESGHGRSERKR